MAEGYNPFEEVEKILRGDSRANHIRITMNEEDLANAPAGGFLGMLGEKFKEMEAEGAQAQKVDAFMSKAGHADNVKNYITQINAMIHMSLLMAASSGIPVAALVTELKRIRGQFQSKLVTFERELENALNDIDPMDK